MQSLLVCIAAVATGAFAANCPEIADYPHCKLDCYFDWNVVPPIGSHTFTCQGVPANENVTVHFSVTKQPGMSAGVGLDVSLNGEKLDEYVLEPDSPQNISVTERNPRPDAGNWQFYLHNRDWLVWKHADVRFQTDLF